MKALLCTGQLVLILLHVHIVSTVTATGTFCQAPPVREGDPANLTCHFPEDLNQRRKGIAVLRRDSILGSRDKFLLGCVWVGEKLHCRVRDGYQLITKQPTHDVTFRIPSHEPGTFHCNYIPPEEAVTIQSCSFTLKGAPGSPPRTVTPSRSDSPTQSTERSLGRNEDDDRLFVTVMVPSVVAALVVMYVIALYYGICSSGKSSGAACFVSKVTERIKLHASPSVPQHGTVESQPQVVDEEAQSCLADNCSTADDDHGTN